MYLGIRLLIYPLIYYRAVSSLLRKTCKLTVRRVELNTVL
jgi:hypothetical protein